MTGIELIAHERHEQIEKHGKTVEQDIAINSDGELVQAAIAILEENFGLFPYNWEDGTCEHILQKDYEGRLITAGALIAAELDKIQVLKNQI